MPQEPLAPLLPFETGATEVFTVPTGEDRPTRPLTWIEWTGATVEDQPNPASNRPENRALEAPTANAIVAQAAALSTLAQSMQKTAERVNSAHAQFLRNQESALEQLQQVHHLLRSLQDQN